MKALYSLLAFAIVAALPLGVAPSASAQPTAPDGRVTFALTITLAPTWFDPAETAGVITPFLTPPVLLPRLRGLIENEVSRAQNPVLHDIALGLG